MTTPAQRRETPTPYPAAKSVAEARKLAENLMEVMSALLSVIERETELVRAGKLREAMKLEPEKSDCRVAMSAPSVISRRARNISRSRRPNF